MRKLLLLPVFVLALAASSPSSASTPNTVVVNITHTGFSPSTVTVQNGDVVTLSEEGDGADAALDSLVSLLERDLDAE